MPLDPAQHAKAMRQANRPGAKKAPPDRIAAVKANLATPRVRVEPTEERFRRTLIHPNAGAFRSSGSLEWPLDQFTTRRIKDGSIRVVQEVAPAAAQAVKAKVENRREQKNETKPAAEKSSG